MAREDWDISDINFYSNEYDDFVTIYEYAKKYNKYIPIDIVQSFLKCSEQKFVDMLNEPIESKRHLITNYEENFRDAVEKGNRRYFNKDWVFRSGEMQVELTDFEDWLDDNYDLLKENHVKGKNIRQQQDDAQMRIDELKAENDALKAQLTDMEKTIRMYKKVVVASVNIDEDTRLENVLQTRAGLKAKNAELKAQLEVQNKQLAELEKAVQEGARAHGWGSEEDFPDEYEGHGVFTLVAKLVHDKTPIEEIMKSVDDEKEFLSQREAGYFFHPSPQGKSPSTLRNYIKNHKAR